MAEGKGILAILGGGGKSKAEDSDDDAMGGGTKVDCARDIIAAVKRGDAGALAAALDEYHSAPKSKSSESEGDDDEEL
jgi:DNA-binding GntR family transcriptional regulator